MYSVIDMSEIEVGEMFAANCSKTSLIDTITDYLGENYIRDLQVNIEYLCILLILKYIYILEFNHDLYKFKSFNKNQCFIYIYIYL